MAVLADWRKIATEEPDLKTRLAAGRLILEAAIGFRRAEATRQVIRPAKESAGERSGPTGRVNLPPLDPPG